MPRHHCRRNTPGTKTPQQPTASHSHHTHHQSQRKSMGHLLVVYQWGGHTGRELEPQLLVLLRVQPHAQTTLGLRGLNPLKNMCGVWHSRDAGAALKHTAASSNSLVHIQALPAVLLAGYPAVRRHRFNLCCQGAEVVSSAGRKANVLWPCLCSATGTYVIRLRAQSCSTLPCCQGCFVSPGTHQHAAADKGFQTRPAPHVPALIWWPQAFRAHKRTGPSPYCHQGLAAGMAAASTLALAGAFLVLLRAACGAA